MNMNKSVGREISVCSLHARSWAGQRPSRQDSLPRSSVGAGRMALGWGCSAGLKAGLPQRSVPLELALPVGPETLQHPWAQAQVAKVRECGYSQGRQGWDARGSPGLW